ncbi:hypothetical protein SAMN05216548_11496 [Faunimonas pinastri]|uniref:Uncharacterized protein n=1 Tax=Faunimonas pinastri TaxID=1855383 RepID=A0A1H9MXT7_9HYPH|nr:hypothetical protein [Faunimonas pinastri]SER28401.1 hypothetical protein SAMN05216548_11496 [Faunimonas pinastri]
MTEKMIPAIDDAWREFRSSPGIGEGHEFAFRCGWAARENAITAAAENAPKAEPLFVGEATNTAAVSEDALWRLLASGKATPEDQRYAAGWIAKLTTPPAADAGLRAGWRSMRDAPRDGTEVLLLHRAHGVIEGRFFPGEWSEETPVSPREYSGATWVLGDDIGQEEVEEFGPDAPEAFGDGAVIGWLPRDALAVKPEAAADEKEQPR